MQRAWFVSRIYGWKNGLLSSHRLIVGTIVNAAATLRAIRQFALSKVTGRKLTWDKTMHHFPPGNELVLPPRNLREILISWRVINNEELSRAIGSEPQSESHLGQVLVSRGLVDAATLDEAMAYLKEVGGGEQKPRTVATLREPLKVS
jgi:adsorption protein B